jgi:hypothetical protein
MPSLPVNFKRILSFAGIFLLVLFVIEFNARIEELNRLSDQRDLARVKATQAAYTQIALQTKVAFAASDQAVEEWARTEGHYVREGDQPVVPIGPTEIPPLEISTPAPSPIPMTNWQVWWNLFFGE